MTKEKTQSPKHTERHKQIEMEGLKKDALLLKTKKAREKFKKAFDKYVEERFIHLSTKLPKESIKKLTSIFKKLAPDYATKMTYDYFPGPPSPEVLLRVYLNGGNVDEWTRNATIANLILENELLEKFRGVYYFPITDEIYRDQERKRFGGYPITIRHYFWRDEGNDSKYILVSLKFSNPEVLHEPTPKKPKVVKRKTTITIYE